MSNRQHLKLLRQGVEVFNKWRAENKEILPDLRSADLTEAVLKGAVFSGVNFSQANLSSAVFTGADLTGADLTGAKLNHATLTGANLSGAFLSRANLVQADLSAANLRGTNLIQADFSEAKLTRTNLNAANLRGAKLIKTDLRGAKLILANLNGTNLSGASFRDALLSGTYLASLDLSCVKGLKSVVHGGPSSIAIDTFLRSKGNIPEVFLRGAGVPESFIRYAVTLAGMAFEFYSCFISYSSKDEALADRLHKDLQSKGVRCWFAPEDLKTGDRFRTRIDEEIDVHDKLLLLLSENSVRSDWVEKEVETALEKERKQKHTVLFPVRLDHTVMEIATGWPADIRRTRHIGNFTRWKNHDAYTQAFDRLLRDLKADTKTAC